MVSLRLRLPREGDEEPGVIDPSLSLLRACGVLGLEGKERGCAD